MDRILTVKTPPTLMFGEGCAIEVAGVLADRKPGAAMVITSPPIVDLAAPVVEAMRERGIETHVWAGVDDEPSIAMFHQALQAAKDVGAEAVIGLGGGSAMDVAKLVAAMIDSDQDVREVFGIGNLAGRSAVMACLPTTSGTGSEVSPNSILLDEQEDLKKGVVSPFLVADAACVDPALTLTVPPAVTAATGVDAMTHCIEAYANRFAHPIVDLYALEGIRLIAANLKRAVDEPGDLEARKALSLGSLYGGLCLGPVNTGAVHALAYPLGGEFHVAHGVSNAVLLPHVIRFNLPAATDRYAKIAVALGAEPGGDDAETADRGLECLRQLSAECGIPASLADLNVPRDAVDRMARAAMTVTRLLKNNPREMTEADARRIYEEAFG